MRCHESRRYPDFRAVRRPSWITPVCLMPPWRRLHSELEDDSIGNVPTLHVLFTRPLDMQLSPSPSVAYPDTAGPTQECVLDELVSWVADEAFGGDKDAAQWFLLVSIARVCVAISTSCNRARLIVPWSSDNPVHVRCTRHPLRLHNSHHHLHQINRYRQ